MASFKSIKSESQETVEEIYNRMAPEGRREAIESLGLSEFERETGIISAHRFAERSFPERSQENSGLFGRHMTWEKAVERFKIPEMYRKASLERMDELNLPLSNFAREWTKKPYSLFLTGSTGSGKTYFAYSLLNSLTETKRYDWIIFVRSDDLDNELLKAIEEKSEQDKITKYQEVPILFIDDLGVERANDRVIKQYYSIIDRRLSNFLPTIFTSNIPIEEIGKNLGDRIASRLELTKEIKFPKKDLRKLYIDN